MTTDDAEKTDLVTLTIDGVEISVPKGTLVIRAAEQIGVQIPRFCDHPLLDAGRRLPAVPGRGRMPDATATQAMMACPEAAGVLHARGRRGHGGQAPRSRSPVADKAQQGIMEFLLINHPLDCPVCDKGGECPLQNQAMSNGRGESRFTETKRTFPKPINISAQVLLDRERCVLCARCTRFSEQIAGDPFIALIERGALQQVGIYEKEPFESYFSGNTIQICPVGALTSASYRFRARPVRPGLHPVGRASTARPAARCAPTTAAARSPAGWPATTPRSTRSGTATRAASRSATPGEDRLTTPLVRDAETGELRPASWPEAFAVAARGPRPRPAAVGVLTGGRLTGEDAYAYSKFARVVLGTNDIDFRARAALRRGGRVPRPRTWPAGPVDVTYADLEKAARSWCWSASSPRTSRRSCSCGCARPSEAPAPRSSSIAPFTSRGLQKMRGTLVRTAPGDEAGSARGAGRTTVTSPSTAGA